MLIKLNSNGHLFSYARLLLTLAAGQLLALLLSSTGVFSQLLEQNYGIDTPTTQVFFMYFLLAMTFTPYLAAFRQDFEKTLQAHGWKYGLLALLDVEGNYCFVLAYQYTSLTSIQVCTYVHCTVYGTCIYTPVEFLNYLREIYNM